MQQMKLSTDKIVGVSKAIYTIIESIENDEVREKILVMFEDVGERFFVAPASNRANYHNCFPGGLAEHSLRVYSFLNKLSAEFGDDVIVDDNVKVVSILHDLGKVGTPTEDYYLPQDSSWHQEKLGEYYLHNTSLMYLGTAQRSLRLCAQYNVPLTDEEYQAILIHDGQYADENVRYKQKECRLALLLHHADMLACQTEKEKYERVYG